MSIKSEEQTSLTLQSPNDIAKYDPSKSQSQTSIDPYATVDKKVSKKDTNLSNVVNENSNSGSGNSDSGNGLYAKVKKVEKKEEIAYAVVDIKESQDKYETVNGGIVRRLTHPDTTVSLEIENVADTGEKTAGDRCDDDDDSEKSGKEDDLTSEKPGVPGFYATVGSSGNQSNEPPSPQKENVVIDAYAVVIKAEPSRVSTIKPEDQEDSGASGFYAQVNEESVSPQPAPPTPPPPHPPHPNGPPVGGDDGSYEPITTDLERCNTYDSISEYKNDSKAKKDKKDHQGDGGKKQKQKHKGKSHKKQDSLGDASAASKSPKNRFSRVNPFKSSKKQKHKHSNENIDSMESSQKEYEIKLSEPIDISSDKNLTLKDKVASLPTSARKSPMSSDRSELSKRHSSPNVPPPLPSVDQVPPPPPSVEQLIHLTQHQKTRRGSSFDACSSPGFFFFFFFFFYFYFFFF